MRFVTSLLLAALLAGPGLAQDQPAPQPPAEQPQPGEAPAPEAPAPPEEEAEPADPAEALAEVSTEKLVESLNDPRYPVREAATALLLADESITEETLKPFINADTPPETVERLLLVAKHHVARQIREQIETQLPPVNAGVGFSHMAMTPEQNPYNKKAGTRVTRTMPGFPGYVYLQPGDIILEIDGRAPASRNEAFIQQWVSNSVTRRAPGDNITLTVGRNGKVLNFTFPTASVLALNEMYTPGLAAVYERQWQAAREELLQDRKPAEGLVPRDAK